MDQRSDLESWREELLTRRAILTGDSRRLRQDGESGGGRAPNHLAEAATDTHDHELAMDRLAATSLTLQEIDEALDRLEDGTFGLCEDCGKTIGDRRLKTKPHARLCIDCQRKEEHA